MAFVHMHAIKKHQLIHFHMYVCTYLFIYSTTNQPTIGVCSKSFRNQVESKAGNKAKRDMDKISACSRWIETK